MSIRLSNYLFAILMVIVVLISVALCSTSCKTSSNDVATYIDKYHIHYVNVHPGFDPDSLYKAFLDCSKDEGDMGCDSCWQVIMNGKVDSCYWHEE